MTSTHDQSLTRARLFTPLAIQVPTDRAVALSIGLLSFSLSLFFSRVVVVVVVQWFQYRYCLDCLDCTDYLIHICTFYRFILTELCLYILSLVFFVLSSSSKKNPTDIPVPTSKKVTGTAVWSALRLSILGLRVSEQHSYSSHSDSY